MSKCFSRTAGLLMVQIYTMNILNRQKYEEHNEYLLGEALDD